jgi:hypothetical protein
VNFHCFIFYLFAILFIIFYLSSIFFIIFYLFSIIFVIRDEIERAKSGWERVGEVLWGNHLAQCEVGERGRERGEGVLEFVKREVGERGRESSGEEVHPALDGKVSEGGRGFELGVIHRAKVEVGKRGSKGEIHSVKEIIIKMHVCKGEREVNKWIVGTVIK